jgi:RecB family exonuclease
VVVPQREDVERVAAGLEAAGLPPACRLPDRSEGTRVLLRLLDCLAPSAGEPFGRRAVLDLLAAAPLRSAEEAAAPRATGAGSVCESALWPDEARQAGVIAGLDQWAERVGRRRRGLEARLAELEAAVGVAAKTAVEAADGAAGQAIAEAACGSAAEASAEPAVAAAGVAALLPEEDDDGEERPATKRLRLAAVRSLAAAAGALRHACGGLADRASWGEWAAALGAAAEELFAPATAAAVRDAAGRLQTVDLLDERVDVAEMCAVLRELLGAARVPVGCVGRQGVAVLTPLEMRGLAFHTVVFTGLAEGGFPARGRPDPILGDAERRGISEALGARLPLAEERVQESMLLFGFACEAARERVVLICPRTDAATGRPRLPSRLLLRLSSLAAGRPVGLDEYLSGEPLRPVWRHATGQPQYSTDRAMVWLDARERDTAVLLVIDAARVPDGVREYLGAVLADAGEVERRMGAWRAARSPVPGPWDGLLGEEARAALAARHPFDAEMHPTRLERYVDCPFAFYLRDVLGLEAPEEPVDALEMEAREFGTLAHEILQRAFEQLIPEWGEEPERLGLAGEQRERPGLADERLGGPDLAAALAVVKAAWRTGCEQAERRGVTGAALAWEVRRATLLDDLLEAVRRDPVLHEDGRPLWVEWRFGEAAGRPVVLELASGRRVRFAGRLDRVDATASGTRVIDYKTGRGATEQERIKRGLSAQLPVYRMAVRQGGGRPGEIACLYRLVTRRGGFADVILPYDEATSSKRLRALVAATVDQIDAGLFPRSARGRCDFCDLAYACGVSAWARTRKREHDLLKEVVRLQRDGPEEVDGGA